MASPQSKDLNIRHPVESQIKQATTSDVEPPLDAESFTKKTVIRLKRRIEDSPSALLVVSYKRSKTEIFESPETQQEGSSPNTEQVVTEGLDSDSAAYRQVLRLVGTVAEEEISNIFSAVRDVLSTTEKPEPSVSFRKNIKAKSTKLTEKTRQNFLQSTTENRFRLVNNKRGVESNDDKSCQNVKGWTDGKELLNLLDLVPEHTSGLSKPKIRPPGFEDGNITCNGIPMVKKAAELSSNEGFVYDLYVSNDPCIEESTSGVFISVEEAEEELDFGDDYRENEDNLFVDDDEDSNAEDNCRNDYPDSEEEGLRDDESYGAAGQSNGYGPDASDDEGVLDRFTGMNVRGDSSSEDEGLIYEIDDDGANHLINFESKYAQLRRFKQSYYSEVVSSDADEDDE